MRIAFYGVTAWGNAALGRLLAADIEIWCVFTRTEAGPCPHFPIENLAIFARGRGCKVIVDRSPDDDPALLVQLQAAKIDLVVSCGYHKKIGSAVLACAPRAINIHPSLLPKYRGSAPSNWVIINGETRTGVTLHTMTSQLDAGDIILQRRMPIASDETAGGLRLRQAIMMGDVLMEYVDGLRSGATPRATTQDDTAATSYRAITRFDARIDPTHSVQAILNLVRGTTPWPGAWLELDGASRAIAAATRFDAGRHIAGTLLERAEHTIAIAARDGAIRYALDRTSIYDGTAVAPRNA